MRKLVAASCVATLGLTLTAIGAEARVIATGTTVDERPTTVVLAESMIEPRWLIVDVTPRVPARVKAEWIVLCSDTPGPVSGGEYLGARPVHRRVELPSRPRGSCFVNVEARYVDPEQTGRIGVRLRGRAKPPPIEI